MGKELLKLSRARSSTGTDARRKDTREKIQLGGLVVKAGLRNADPAYLLGVFMEAGHLYNTSPEYRARMIEMGRKGFLT